MSLTHEDLFALRFALQEIYIDENEIVKKLKLKCIDSGMSEEDTNSFLVEFYSIYGITFTLEEIQNVNVSTNATTSSNLPSNSSSNNPFLNILNNPFVGNNPFIQSINNINPNNSSNVFNSGLVQILMNPNTIAQNSEEEILDDDDDNDDDIPELEDDEDDFSDLPELEESDEDNNTQNDDQPSISNFTGSANIFNSTNSNVPGITYTFNPQNPSTGRININAIRSLLLQSLNGASNMDDVVVSLDDEDLSNIKSYKYEKDKEESKLKCTICMDFCNEGEEICELKCGHKFHKDCIIPYLKDYNYKCPICRTEVGKAKYNT